MRRRAAALHRRRHVSGLVAMREPVVRHELDPERAEHVERRRRLVVAARRDRVVRQSLARVAAGRLRLEAREKLAADALRIRIRSVRRSPCRLRASAIAAELGKRRLEWDVPRERFVRRSPSAGCGCRCTCRPRCGSGSARRCRAARHRRRLHHTIGCEGRQPHLVPHLERGSGDPVAALDVVLDTFRCCRTG